ncbi:uncharacterized protein LOC108601261 [Drosophila busckii]|uniref:uncharacterized protein LOC108601261 n=1 Tax=Drosophila busckii TaxID=30019 RepID=UPI00083EC14D|nr:uncharacterized protein LOC108601261 [Drosophila busckii]
MLSFKVIFVLGLTLAVASAGEPQLVGGITTLSGDELKEAETQLNSSLKTLAAGEGPNYQLGKIISARKQVVSGFKYYYEVELVEGSKTKTCKVEIWSQPWMPNGVEVIFDCPDGKVTKKHNAQSEVKLREVKKDFCNMFAIKVIFVLSLALAVVSASPALTTRGKGAITALSGDRLKEAEAILESSLIKLADGEGPHYTLGRVISASHQTVSGSKYRYEAELLSGDKTVQCKVEIWSQPWLDNGIEVTFDCPEGKVVKNHSA